MTPRPAPVAVALAAVLGIVGCSTPDRLDPEPDALIGRSLATAAEAVGGAIASYDLSLPVAGEQPSLLASAPASPEFLVIAACATDLGYALGVIPEALADAGIRKEAAHGAYTGLLQGCES